MIIQGILQYQQREAEFKAFKPGPGKSRDAQPVPRDTFEPSHKKIEIRRDLVDTVKKKIERGYYNSETVLDDLGNSFAKVLTQAMDKV